MVTVAMVTMNGCYNGVIISNYMNLVILVMRKKGKISKILIFHILLIHRNACTARMWGYRNLDNLLK